jgi:hypothetical protein
MIFVVETKKIKKVKANFDDLEREEQAGDAEEVCLFFLM